ncbi:MAG: molybdopterin molybdotransferase MoeA [Pirellulales bacterium]|nr:molybdopterin molybdotransferase MoeA [Pirellulales bacterium]
MLTVEEALELVKAHCEPLRAGRVPLESALGLVLATNVASDVDSPPHNKALMDGYAVRSADRDSVRHIVEEIPAGGVPHYPLTPGAVSRIMTGAPLPEGADAVVPIEDSEMVTASTVRLHQTDAPPEQHVLRRGAAMRAGEVVLRQGTLVRPVEIAILAETGQAFVDVIPRPRVMILPTGNELVEVSAAPGPGQLRNSNGPMLASLSTQAGANAKMLPPARDSLDDLARNVSAGLETDILVLSGGVSAGAFDFVPRVLAEQGVEQVFHRIALRPGKPLWFGVKRSAKRSALVFGLPGNPVSSLVCFELFVRPALAALAGRGFALLVPVRAKLTHDFHHTSDRASCLPAVLKSTESGMTVEMLPWHGSADLATLARANGLARVSAETRSYSAGCELDVLPL